MITSHLCSNFSNSFLPRVEVQVLIMTYKGAYDLDPCCFPSSSPTRHHLYFSPATLAPLLFLEHTKRVPASGLLHLLFPMLRILFSQLFSLLFSSISFRCLLESYLLNESFCDSSKMTNHEYHYSWHSLFLFLAL